MRFIREIREELGLTPTEMGKKTDLLPVQRYLTFENAERTLSPKSLIMIWRLSKLPAQEFMQRMEREVNGGKID